MGFLGVKGLRAAAFMCLGAIVGKGMPELDKLAQIQGTRYLEVLA